jgi:transketolase
VPPEVLKYRHTELPPAVKRRIAIEQSSTLGRERYAGSSGKTIGISVCALKELLRKFGFEPERAVAPAKELLGYA